MRYAIYFAPAPESRWWQFGCRWLGRDPLSGKTLRQFSIPGIKAQILKELTAEPRRYGFHATLKPPFVLADGVSPEELFQEVEVLAMQHSPVVLSPMKLQCIGSASGGFLALVPVEESMELATLAATCVEQLDAFRTPPGPSELSRRRAARLSSHQDELLQRWGYPYVMDEWRFHMTLTGKLAAHHHKPVAAWLNSRLSELASEPLALDALCVFQQAAPGEAFLLTRRFKLAPPGMADPAGGEPGKLFYLVGPSGAGKDSLMQYARTRLSNSAVEFAHRYITRPVEAGGEYHYALSPDEFQVRSQRGVFAMQWKSHGQHYGIGTEIDRWLEQGKDVVVNGSREYLEEARVLYPELTVIWVKAATVTLRKRLAERGREDDAAIEQRLARATQFLPSPDAIVIENNASLGDAGELLIRVLTGGAAGIQSEPEPAPVTRGQENTTLLPD